MPVTIHSDVEEKLDDIIEWSLTKKKFDATTFYGIRDNYEEYGSFTHSQEIAIENVWSKWKIDRWKLNKSALR